MGPPAGASRAADGRGFLSSLFDFSFTSFVTTRIVKVLYILILVLVSLVALFYTIIAFRLSPSLWHRPYQIVRRGCLFHAVPATWMWHPRRIRGTGAGAGAESPVTGICGNAEAPRVTPRSVPADLALDAGVKEGAGEVNAVYGTHCSGRVPGLVTVSNRYFRRVAAPAAQPAG